jgi:SAM-dependent methyltransferase
VNAPPLDAKALVERSVRRYRRAHRAYERRHPEIFNPVEQDRLRRALARAAAEIRGPEGGPRRALDLGCGSGNLTGHLLALGFDVTAADVSPEFLRTVRRRFGVDTLRLNGIDLAGVPDGSFDLAAAYSVLHHIPDYLAMVGELARVVRPGGVVVLDHEANEHFWGPDGCAHHFRQELSRRELERPRLWNPARRRWQRYLMPSKYVLGLRLLVDPDYLMGIEGDIHVWAEDHIAWNRIEERLGASGCEVVAREDYLNYHEGYPDDLYAAWRDSGCTDMRCLLARRR